MDGRTKGGKDGVRTKVTKSSKEKEIVESHYCTRPEWAWQI